MDFVLAGLWRATWQGSVLFVVVAILVRCTPRISPSLHCWGWRIVCLKMLLTFFVAGALRLPLLPETTDVEPSGGRDAAIASGFDLQRADRPRSGIGDFATAGRLAYDATIRPVDTVAGIAPAGWSWKSGLLLIWLTGIGYQLSRLWIDWKDVQRAKRSAIELSDAPVVRVLRSEVIDAGMAVCPRLFVDESARCPAVVGMLSPVILVPRSVLDTSNQEQLRMLLRHELAHVRRCDLWWNWIAAATRFLFYFHPLVYVTLREWRLNQESACDELAVVGRPESSSHYAAMLLQIAVTQNPSRSLAYAVGVFESFETLKRRIEKMSQFGSRSSRHVQLAAMAFAVAAVAGLIPWKLVPSAAIGSAAVVAADIDHSNAVTKVGDMTIAVADVRDVSGLKHETRSDFSRLMKQMKLKAETKGFQTSKSASSPNAIASASGSGFGGGGGGGAFGTTKFAGHPNLAVALKVRPTKNTQVTIVDHLIGIDNDGREYKSLPTSSTAFMVCPDYERTQPDSAIAYFTKDTMAVREFAVLKGRLQVETAESETVEFKALRRNATKRTRLGEYKITALEKSDDGIKVAIQTPTPASLRSKLELRPRDARGFQGRMEAQRDLPGMIRVSFIGSDGNSYHANTRGSHGSGQSTSSTTTTITTNGFQTKTSGGFSSQKAGVAEYIYGLTTLPAGVEIVGVRATVLEVPTSISEVEFQIENVQIRE